MFRTHTCGAVSYTHLILILFCCVVSELSMPFIGFSALPAFMSGEKHKEKNRTPIRAVVCTLFEVDVYKRQGHKSR